MNVRLWGRARWITVNLPLQHRRPLKRVKLGSIKGTNQCTDEHLGTFFHYCKLAVTGDLAILLVGESLLAVFYVLMKDKYPEMDGLVRSGIPQMVWR